MLRLDTSEWMRNGDYEPTRILAQEDAANYLCNIKMADNPENTVSLVTFGGDR